MSSGSTPAIPPPHVAQNTFLGFIWGGVAVSTIFLLGRLFSRLRGRRILWDDGFVSFSWLLALLTAIVWQYVAHPMYIFLDVESGLIGIPKDDVNFFFEKSSQYYIGQLIVLVFFYTSLWSVKLSFLLFFKRLGENVDKQKYIWWPVCVFTVSTYFVCIGTIQYKCLSSPLPYIIANCSSDSDIDFTLVTLKVNCAFDVICDVFIMIIPTSMLWTVRIPWQKKLALTGLFSLVLVTIVFSIVRVTEISTLTKQPDPTWLWLWSGIEQNIAIVVACLSAFPQLFAQTVRVPKPVYKPSDTYLHRVMKWRSKQKASPLYDLSGIEQSGDFDYIRTADAEAGFGYSAASASSSRPVLGRV